MAAAITPYSFNNTITHQRPIDGYVDATNICRSCNKRFNDYLRTQRRREFIKELVIPLREYSQQDYYKLLGEEFRDLRNLGSP